MKSMFRKTFYRQTGQSLPELGAIIALVVIVCIMALSTFGNYLSTVFTNLANNIDKSTSKPLGG